MRYLNAHRWKLGFGLLWRGSRFSTGLVFFCCDRTMEQFVLLRKVSQLLSCHRVLCFHLLHKIPWVESDRRSIWSLNAKSASQNKLPIWKPPHDGLSLPDTARSMMNLARTKCQRKTRREGRENKKRVWNRIRATCSSF